MLRVGLSFPKNLLSEESFQKAAQSGIRDIEISPVYSDYQSLNYKETKQLADKYGVNLWSYHLPFATTDVLDIASTDEKMRKSSVDYWCELIKKGADIGIDKFIAHPSSEPKGEGKQREEEIKRSQESLCTVADVAQKNGAVIAVEDLPRSCLGHTADELLRLVSVDSRLKICFDTNHLLEDDNINFIEKTAEKIITLHVSDYDFVNERHWLPGEGKIDWQKIYNKLIECGYNGVWLYEIGLKCPKTIIRDRDLTFADFYRNATEIFENKKLTVFSKHKEKLGMWE